MKLIIDFVFQSSDDGYNNYNSVSKNKRASKISQNQNQKLNNITSAESNTSSKIRYNNEENGEENMAPIANNSPDSGFINTLRYGMLAVRLLPRSSISSKFFFAYNINI